MLVADTAKGTLAGCAALPFRQLAVGIVPFKIRGSQGEVGTTRHEQANGE
jgi:hypothetical protein